MSGCHPIEVEEKSDVEVIHECLTRIEELIHGEKSDMLDRINKLEEHHIRQIDENRKISARVDALEEQQKHDMERITYLNQLIIKLQKEVEKHDEQLQAQFSKNRLIVGIIDELKSSDKFLFNKISKEEKKIGLSFYEAAKLCKNGKNLTRVGWKESNYFNGFMYFDEESYRLKVYLDETFNKVQPRYDDVVSNDWEIVE